MIKYTNGSIFELQVDAIVNPVNTVGVMGAGLAKAFRILLNGNYMAYRAHCDKGLLRPGRLYITHDQSVYKMVINAATKDHYRDPSKLKWVDECLIRIRNVLLKGGITSIALPALGCGLGGLNFDDVKPLIEQRLGDLTDIQIFVYLPR